MHKDMNKQPVLSLLKVVYDEEKDPNAENPILQFQMRYDNGDERGAQVTFEKHLKEAPNFALMLERTARIIRIDALKEQHGDAAHEHIFDWPNIATLETMAFVVCPKCKATSGLPRNYLPCAHECGCGQPYDVTLKGEVLLPQAGGA